MQDLQVLGVIEWAVDGARVVYLNERVVADDSILANTSPAAPTEVYRMSVVCESYRCIHFKEQRCRLASRIGAMLPAVVDVLPVCTIRSNCPGSRRKGAKLVCGAPKL